MSTSKIKVGDTVQVITGKDKGKEGKVIRIDHKAGRVVVEGVNMLTKHNKVSAQNPNGGIIHVEGSIDISNVMYVKNGKPTRVGFEIRDGKKVRIAKIDGSVID